MGVSEAIFVGFPGLVKVHGAILTPLNYSPASVCPEKCEFIRILRGILLPLFGSLNPKAPLNPGRAVPLTHPSRMGGRLAKKEGELASKLGVLPRSLSQDPAEKEKVGNKKWLRLTERQPGP